MARGFEGIRDAAADIESRKGGASQRGPGALYFRLQDGEETNVRFLEQDDDIVWCWMHEIPVEGRSWGRQTPCLDQERDDTPCPGCERDMDRKFRGFINLIWEDAPIFKRDEQGKIVRDSTGDPVSLGTKAQVGIWSSGIRLFEELDEINANYKGLMSRKFKVKRKGSRLDTKYLISPQDIDAGPQEMGEEEAVLAESKFDLSEFVTPKSYDEFLTELTGGVSNGGGTEQQAVNPFMRNR